MTMDQRGSALIEGIFFCLILMVPLAWGLAVLDQVHRAALASTAAVRDAGFEAVRAADVFEAERAIDRAVADALRDHELELSLANVTWAAPGKLARGTRVEIAVTYRVHVLGDWLPFASVPISARHALYVEPFASRDA